MAEMKQARGQDRGTVLCLVFREKPDTEPSPCLASSGPSLLLLPGEIHLVRLVERDLLGVLRLYSFLQMKGLIDGIV